MHRRVMGVERGDPRTVDHIDPNYTLDNRRSTNLRFASRLQQAHNQRKRPSNSSGHKGITIDADRTRKPFRARIMVNYKEMYLGRCATMEEAIALQEAAAVKYHKEFARSE